jgi:hypothetical protein
MPAPTVVAKLLTRHGALELASQALTTRAGTAEGAKIASRLAGMLRSTSINEQQGPRLLQAK